MKQLVMKILEVLEIRKSNSSHGNWAIFTRVEILTTNGKNRETTHTFFAMNKRQAESFIVGTTLSGF